MVDSQLAQYIPVLILAFAAMAFSFGTLVASEIIGRVFNRTRKLSQHLPIKDTAYECGMVPIGEGNSRLSVKFYLVAMLFILFDIEAIFLYPWAVVYKQLKMFGFLEMLTFVVLILAGFFFIWKKGVLDWAHQIEPVAVRPVLARLDLTPAELVRK
jgi:NADH-quinone oxidoreductase subunit A